MARVFLKEVVNEARRRLPSADHFAVDGTLLEAGPSHKYYQPRDEGPPRCGCHGWRVMVAGPLPVLDPASLPGCTGMTTGGRSGGSPARARFRGEAGRR